MPNEKIIVSPLRNINTDRIRWRIALLDASGFPLLTVYRNHRQHAMTDAHAMARAQGQKYIFTIKPRASAQPTVQAKA